MNELTLHDLMQNQEIRLLIDKANQYLEQIGYTDHGPRHVLHVSRIAGEILEKLGYSARQVELARIAGYLHDVGNMIHRDHHGKSGAILLYPILRDLYMPPAEVADIVSAIGSHECPAGRPISALSAALIIADKVDAHKSRVRENRYDPNDIHDRVNYSIKKARVDVDPQARLITFGCTMDETSSVTEYMQIYLERMIMCEQSAEFLGCKFILEINGMRINRIIN